MRLALKINVIDLTEAFDRGDQGHKCSKHKILKSSVPFGPKLNLLFTMPLQGFTTRERFRVICPWGTES